MPPSKTCDLCPAFKSARTQVGDELRVGPGGLRRVARDLQLTARQHLAGVGLGHPLDDFLTGSLAVRGRGVVHRARGIDGAGELAAGVDRLIDGKGTAEVFQRVRLVQLVHREVGLGECLLA